MCSYEHGIPEGLIEGYKEYDKMLKVKEPKPLYQTTKREREEIAELLRDKISWLERHIANEQAELKQDRESLKRLENVR